LRCISGRSQEYGSEIFEKLSFLPSQLNLLFYLTGVRVQVEDPDVEKGRAKFLTDPMETPSGQASMD
jgi:hypothetical protein